MDEEDGGLGEDGVGGGVFGGPQVDAGLIVDGDVFGGEAGGDETAAEVGGV